ncbi:MAG TPA: glycosyltransferase [Thermoanaerobaculia bacterium]|jgi:N-acetylglucosaminyl-diphospho-decaprenol L-rhamnosyltransferase|nr:glycosyltransferase [Thermoanaerobaculia bacterium]
MISLLVVNYRSSALAAEAIRTARASTSQPLQVVVVDNSCDAAEAHALRDHADQVLVSDTNRGYAGGINLGRRACQGDTLIVSNPDVTFAPGAIDYLHDALRDAAVAGPAFFWDADHQWMLPPGDLNTAPEKLDEVLASRSPAWAEQRDRRRFHRRVAFWSQQQTSRTRMLSGAVMAIRAADFDDVDGFDERFALYFEESDFLRRITEIRKRIVHVPSARCRHLFNQSASQVASEAAARYAQSEMRYLEKWNGPFLARLLKRIERPLPSFDTQPLRLPLRLERDDVVIEVSPLASFATAAGHFPRDREIDVPHEILTSMHGELYLRVVVRESGDILETYKIKA